MKQFAPLIVISFPSRFPVAVCNIPESLLCELELHVLCKMGLSAWPAMHFFFFNFPIVVDIQYYFMFVTVWFLVLRTLLLFGVQAERVKSLKRIVVELARHLHNRRTLCSFLWCFSSPSKEGTNCAVGSRTSALTVGSSMLCSASHLWNSQFSWTSIP